MQKAEKTAFGRWLDKQPRGTKRRIELKTGLAYSTVLYAMTRRVSLEVAKLLSAATRGAVKISELKGASRGRPSAKRRAS